MKRLPACLAACAALGYLTLAGLQADPIEARVVRVIGLAEFAPPESVSFQPLKAGQLLAIGSTVRTGSDGRVVLRTTPGSAVDLGGDSNLKINELAFRQSGGAVTERKARLELTSGVASALIDPSTPKVTDFEIQTPEGAAAARGTFYTVAVQNGKTYTRVGEGKIAAIAENSRGAF